MTGATLEATALRVGTRVILVPVGQPLPEDAVVYGKVRADVVYQTFYEATHCRRGHRRLDGPGTRCRAAASRPSNCSTTGYADQWPPEWTWGRPA